MTIKQFQEKLQVLKNEEEIANFSDYRIVYTGSVYIREH